ncbi:MAG: UDP-N-acetylmuramate dehydrogenase [Thermodesulfobacteriota bacterium]|nr:UDP-N-acetylmuramate dehydrogenase [Thermodesulfobacteriota bacterium]
MTDLLNLTGIIKGEVRYSVPMSDYTSFRVGGQVDCLVYPADVPDLQNILRWCNQQGVRHFILGNGTNLLVRDGGIRGMAISLSNGFRQIKEAGRGPEENLIFAAAGGPLGNLVDFSSEKGLTGLEFAAGIPGTVGGAIFMNAGAFRGEMKEVLHSVKLMDSAGQVSEKGREALRFSYRSMELGKGEIILGGQFQLRAGNGQEVQAKIEENIRRRKAKQPWDLPSAGSVFKNPDGGPAGRLIEEAGLKGCRIGDAQVSEKHANFIVNRGKAKAKDILTLVEKVRQKVFQEKGVWLELEIQVIGED